jgi:hypothetical protein
LRRRRERFGHPCQASLSERERFVEWLARLVGEDTGVLCAYVLLDNHLGIATASLAAHLHPGDAETI